MSRSAVSSAPPERLKTQPRPLRRLTLELFGVVALKIAALTLIWWVVFVPQPKPDVSPGAIAQRLAPAVPAPTEAHP
ncbi:cytochrome oxidase putative small subunit CydP [Rhodanobacter ginsengiterrae]|uniref:cytochrome oxidase putative small subunit CydP n=1 Tax=Rhodanobacter ginsengiterrae TaxID=2008451 RepID=UPI003CF0F7A6